VLLLAIAALPACTANSGEKSEQQNRVAGYVGETPITVAEVEDKATGELKKLEQQRFELLQNTLNAIAMDKMLAAEAEARGVTTEELIQIEVRDKVAEPTVKEISAFYEQNKARMGERTLEETSDRIKQHLAQQRATERAGVFENELKQKTGFRVTLEPPRYELQALTGETSSGPADAPVTIVEYADYQCPYCKRSHPGLVRLLADYGEKVRYVYRDFPLNFHPRAVPAAVAARCAGEQDNYWDYHNNLLEMEGDLSDDDLKQRAEQIGLNVDEFSACLTAGRYEDTIQAAFESGQKLGVTGTPSYFINGRMKVGAVPYEQLKEIVDDELARLEGTKAQSGS
jgi:protein-disulfide isomerase